MKKFEQVSNFEIFSITVSPEVLPIQTGPHKVDCSNTDTSSPIADVTSHEKEICWKSFGPFETKQGEGSRVIYRWYCFAKQLVLLNVDLIEEVCG